MNKTFIKGKITEKEFATLEIILKGKMPNSHDFNNLLFKIINKSIVIDSSDPNFIDWELKFNKSKRKNLNK